MRTYRLVGRKIKVVKKGAYFGCTGVIQYCNTCCRAYRIQFDGMGNNEKLKEYRKKIIFID